MLTSIEVDKIQTKLEKTLKRKISRLVPMASVYGINRKSKKRVFMVKIGFKKYTLLVGTEVKKLNLSRVRGDKNLQHYFPKLYLYEKPSKDLPYYLTLEEYVDAHKLSAILLHSKTTAKKKFVYIKRLNQHISDKNKYMGKKSSSRKVKSEINKIIEEFSSEFIINQSLKRAIKEQLNVLVEELPEKSLIEREVNFDFIPDNILVDKEDNLKVIDFEYSWKSNLYLLELVRMFYYLSYDKFIRNDELNFHLNSFFFEYGAAELLMVNSQLFKMFETSLSDFGISSRSYPKLLLLFFLVESLLQQNAHQAIIDLDSVKNSEEVCQYLMAEDPARSLVVKTSNLSKPWQECKNELDCKAQTLNEIIDSKFFKTWQLYCRTRDKLFREKS